MIIIQYILFFLVCIVSFYIPGRLAIDFLKLSLKSLDGFIAAWLLGISLFLLGTYAFSWIQMPQIYLILIILINIHVLFRKKHILFKFEKLDYLSLFIIALGSLSFLYIMFFSGYISNSGIQFIGVNGQDGIRHISYIKNQIFTFPPQHPGLYGEELKGFHYFYDFLLAKFSQFYLFSVEDLYFRLFPFLISLLYGLSFYFLSSKLTKNIVAVRLIIFFAYFARSFSIIYYLFNNEIDLLNSPIIHPIRLILNPFIVLAIGILVTGFALLPEVKKSFKYAIVVGLIFGVLSQIKVYAGLIAIGTISIYSFYVFLRFKKKFILNYFILLFITAVITAITFLPNNFKQAGLVFYPLEFYKHYISSHGFENINWDTRRMIFEQYNNYLRIVLLYIEAVIIFWIYNLGVLSIILLKITNIFKKKFWLEDYNIIILLSIIIPIFIASFFLQSVSAFDTVQFLWITIPLFGIPAGIIFAKIIENRKIVKFIVLMLIISLSLPGNINALVNYSPVNVKITANNNQLEFFGRINKTIPSNNFMIYIPKIKPFDKNYFGGTPVISAISGISVYLEGGNLPNKLNSVYEERLKNILNLNKDILACDKTKIEKDLKKIGSKYIISENKYSCFENDDRIKIINSDKYRLYIYN
jgi:hypothetical protein